MNDAVIVSDIHLGSSVCQSKRVLELLKHIETGVIDVKEIIINGDLFDSWDFRKLRGSHWKVLSKMRSLAKSKHIVWINGNHDGPAEIISHLIGVDFVDEYVLVSENKKILILHGDKFDKFIADHPIFTKMADLIYRAMQKIDASFYLAKLAKRSSKTFLRCSEQIMERAKIYAESKNVDIVCCGHTHMIMQNEKDKVYYYNSGCWTENPCHYILINKGTASINQF